jgi:hypothetical protein
VAEAVEHALGDQRVEALARDDLTRAGSTSPATVISSP